MGIWIGFSMNIVRQITPCAFFLSLKLNCGLLLQTSTQPESGLQPSLAHNEKLAVTGIASEPTAEIDTFTSAAASAELPLDESLPSQENKSPPIVQETPVQHVVGRTDSPVIPISPDLRQQDSGQPEPRNSPEMRLDINHALQYLDSVKAQFEDRPSVRQSSCYLSSNC